MAAQKRTELAKQVNEDMMGLRYHADNLNLFGKDEEIKNGDLVFLTDYQIPNTGYLAVAVMSEWVKDICNNSKITFNANGNLKGLAGRTEWIRSFAQRVVSIKGELKPMNYIHAYPTKHQKSDTIEMENRETGQLYEVKLSRVEEVGKVKDSGIKSGYENEDRIEFASFGFSGYPISCKKK